MQYKPNECGGTTDHSQEIVDLRVEAFKLNEIMHLDGTCPTEGHIIRSMALSVAADLLELHDRTGISLDNWRSARAMVEFFLHAEILENGV